MNNLTIVMYHYVRDLVGSKFPRIRGLDLKLFLEQILFFRKHYHFISAEQLISSLENGDRLPKNPILLSFDDAYVDHYENVLPILNRYKIQGSFYIPVKAVTRNAVLDVNKIHYILASGVSTRNIISLIKERLRFIRLNDGIQTFEHYASKIDTVSRYDDKETMFIKNLLQFGLPSKVKGQIVDYLFELTIGIEEKMFSKTLYMSLEQISAMLGHGMHIGCHGYDHLWWDRMDKAELEVDIGKSLEFLVSLGVNKEAWTACYPFGGYNNLTVDILYKKGFKYALTTEVGVANVLQKNRFLLPRLDTNDLPKNKNSPTNKWYI